MEAQQDVGIEVGQEVNVEKTMSVSTTPSPDCRPQL